MLASFLIAPPTFGTIVWFGTADKLVSVGIGIGFNDNPRYSARRKVEMGKGRCGITPRGGCSTIELLPHMLEQVGIEPTTNDNPQLRPTTKLNKKEVRLLWFGAVY